MNKSISPATIGETPNPLFTTFSNTLSELALETFFPADELTARRLREMAPRD